MVSSKNNDENDKSIDHLNEVLSIENAAIERLERRILETHTQDSKKLLQQHLQEEKEQQRRLIDILSTYGKKPTDSKADLISLHSLTNEARDKMKKDNVNTHIDTKNITKISTAIHDDNNINMSHITDANEWREESLKGLLCTKFQCYNNQEINVLNVQFIIAMNM
jgi:ferritin-like metal-binding protein YciE